MTDDMMAPPQWWGDSAHDLDQVAHTLEFIQNRVDHVAEWVVEWMPPEDNEAHHNAVEHLLRVWQEAERVRRHLLVLAGDTRLRARTPDPYTYTPKSVLTNNRSSR